MCGGNLNPLLVSVLLILLGITCLMEVQQTGLNTTCVLSNGDNTQQFDTDIPLVAIAPISLVLGLLLFRSTCKDISEEGLFGCSCCIGSCCDSEEKKEDD
jgi:hypothetical protein